MWRIIKTLFLVAVLTLAGCAIGFMLTFTIAWSVESPLAEYLEGAVCLLLIAAIAWAGYRFFQTQQP